MKHLQELHIRRSSFLQLNYEIPNEIEHLASTLTVLTIYSTKVEHLSQKIGKLTKLETLMLSKTNLTALPNSIGNLISLSRLSLPNNKLTSLPGTMKNLQALINIELDNNPFLHSIDSLSGLANLEYLQASRCSIECIPFDLPNLNALYLTRNNISDLFGVHTLGYKSNALKNFYLNQNSIHSVSPEIQKVRNLHWLNLDNNYLSDLPCDIFDISTLRYLYIRNNNFTVNVLNNIVAKFNITNRSMKIYYSPVNH